LVELAVDELLEEDDDGNKDQRKRVWSSEPEIRISGVVLRMLSYRALASRCAGIENNLNVNYMEMAMFDAYLLHLMRVFYWCNRKDPSGGQNPC